MLTISRATHAAREGAQFGYNPFTYNCENFVVQCKTGQSRCKQMEELVTKGFRAITMLEQFGLIVEPFLFYA